MSNVHSVTEQTFPEQVLTAQGPVLVDFYADWCGPCQTQAPILESFAAQQTDSLAVVKVNVDEAPEVAQRYGIRSIPTLALFANGEVLETRVGTTTAAQLNELVRKHSN